MTHKKGDLKVAFLFHHADVITPTYLHAWGGVPSWGAPQR